MIEEQDKEYIKGQTGNYLIVKIKSNELKKYHNKLVKLEVTDALEEELIGNIM